MRQARRWPVWTACGSALMEDLRCWNTSRSCRVPTAGNQVRPGSVQSHGPGFSTTHRSEGVSLSPAVNGCWQMLMHLFLSRLSFIWTYLVTLILNYEEPT